MSPSIDLQEVAGISSSACARWGTNLCLSLTLTWRVSRMFSTRWSEFRAAELVGEVGWVAGVDNVLAECVVCV